MTIMQEFENLQTAVEKLRLALIEFEKGKFEVYPFGRPRKPAPIENEYGEETEEHEMLRRHEDMDLRK